MSSLLESGKYSDFTIKCGSKQWKVHRAIICPQSKFFETLCDSDFKEAKSAEINLSDEAPSDIQAMLEFLYTGQYSIAPLELPEEDFGETNSIKETLGTSSQTADNSGDDGNGEGSESESNELGQRSVNDHGEPTTTPLSQLMSGDMLRERLHIVMYALGDKFMIEKLKTEAAQTFKEGLPDEWTSDQWCLVIDIDQKTASTDQVLRAPIIELWLQNGIELLKTEEFRENIAKFPDMELQFLRKHATDLSSTISALGKTVEAQAGTIDSHSGIVGALSNRRDNLKKSLKQLAVAVNGLDGCRHCDNQFYGLLEEKTVFADDNVIYTLRCRGCRTKHPLV
ncbi:hypothetical protein TWF730_010125 [Orbilia blumenaviensis]|uniref:BTB domain-containing protein n=1 Tax=Orbilia blumenaviensis TaxID=1796055 RepID=A0AAV9UV69_9PEZI